MLEKIETSKAPRAMGPYSQAVKAGALLFVSGQIPMDPETGTLVSGSIEEQTMRVLDNIGSILSAAGASFDRLVKTTIFLRDMDSFTRVNEVYGSFFSGTFPARACVEVSRLPKDVNIEIEAVAVLP